MSVDLEIIKVNEVYAKINCERHVAKELSEFFTFYVPGYQFVPAYRNRIWDGKIRLFNRNTNELYLGLIPYLKEFCDEREYTYEIEELEDEFSIYQADKFFKSLNLHSNGNPITVNDHQRDAFIAIIFLDIEPSSWRYPTNGQLLEH